MCSQLSASFCPGALCRLPIGDAKKEGTNHCEGTNRWLQALPNPPMSHLVVVPDKEPSSLVFPPAWIGSSRRWYRSIALCLAVEQTGLLSHEAGVARRARVFLDMLTRLMQRGTNKRQATKASSMRCKIGVPVRHRDLKTYRTGLSLCYLVPLGRNNGTRMGVSPHLVSAFPAYGVDYVPAHIPVCSVYTIR